MKIYSVDYGFKIQIYQIFRVKFTDMFTQKYNKLGMSIKEYSAFPKAPALMDFGCLGFMAYRLL